MKKIGNLESLELNSVFHNEATEFTPWLAEEANLSLLSDAIGIELLSPKTEMSLSSSHRADIICEDSDGRKIVIENQIYPSNDNHIGQMLSYAAALDSMILIWVASDFKDDHRAVIEYLNRITNEDFAFFGVRAKVLKIADSDPAILFEVVAKPNSWTGKSGSLDDRARFMTGLKDQLDKSKKGNYSVQSPGWNEINVAVGISSVYFTIRLNKKGLQVVLKLPKGGVYEKMFDLRDEIESAMPELDIEWNQVETRKYHDQIIAQSNFDFHQTEVWGGRFQWAADTLNRMYTVIIPKVREIVKSLKKEITMS